VRPGDRVLDIGCHQGEFIRSVTDRIGASVGIDPLARPDSGPYFRILAEPFREPMPFNDQSFDAVVLLATLEHIAEKEPLARECERLLSPHGRIIITVPTPFVDRILALLCCLRLADGMSLEEHHGFDPSETASIFARHGFEPEYQGRFQLGLNRLFVLRKRADAHSAEATVVDEPADARVGVHV
jgi:SAM-dependent methyltransferase